MSSFPPYASLLSTVNNNVHGTWDDHDYGTNDAGSELPSKVRGGEDRSDELTASTLT